MKKIRRCYGYNGGTYTIPELARLSGIPYSTIYARLQDGFSIEEAVSPGLKRCDARGPVVDKKWDGKTLEVVFHKRVPVFQHMQPSLEKVYIAEPGVNNASPRRRCRQHFLITLESGNKLIVYPNEFEVIGEAT